MFPYGSAWRSTKHLRAELITDGPSVIPPLQYAWVMKVSKAGIAITGTEYIARRPAAKSRVDSYRQTWWCKVPIDPNIAPPGAQVWHG